MYTRSQEVNGLVWTTCGEERFKPHFITASGG